MSRSAAELTPAELVFLTDRHLATLTTTRADGTPHVVPVGFSFDAPTGIARVICSDGTQKVANVERSGQAAICQVDGGNWLTLEGTASVRREPDAVADACARYGARYQPPRPNPERVVIELTVTRVLGKVRD